MNVLQSPGAHSDRTRHVRKAMPCSRPSAGNTGEPHHERGGLRKRATPPASAEGVRCPPRTVPDHPCATSISFDERPLTLGAGGDAAQRHQPFPARRHPGAPGTATGVRRRRLSPTSGVDRCQVDAEGLGGPGVVVEASFSTSSAAIGWRATWIWTSRAVHGYDEAAASTDRGDAETVRLAGVVRAIRLDGDHAGGDVVPLRRIQRGQLSVVADVDERVSGSMTRATARAPTPRRFMRPLPAPEHGEGPETRTDPRVGAFT